MGRDTICTTAHFLEKNQLYETEKPYSLRFPPPDGFPRQNTRLEEYEINVQDVRELEPLSFDVEGCTVLNLQSSMEYKDYDDEEKVKGIYLREVSIQLREYFGASKVQIFEHRIRRRHINFPISTGNSYQYDQPTSVVHVDTTLDWVLSMVRRLNPDSAEDMLKSRVHVWKPISGPVKDWPLALCSAATIDPAKDLEPCDLVYSDYVVENMQTYHTDQQKWFFMSDQLPNEAWVFLQADSNPGAVPGEFLRLETIGGATSLIEEVPHVAIPLPEVSPGAFPSRESIELRALVYYEALGDKHD